MRKEEKEKILKILDDKGFMEYGAVIPRIFFEDLFQTKFEDGWEFLGPYLAIKECLEENGYLCTSEGLPLGYLKIYDAEEMAFKADVIIKNLRNKFKKLEGCFINAKSSEFSQNEYKKYLLACSKIHANVNALNSVLATI